MSWQRRLPTETFVPFHLREALTALEHAEGCSGTELRNEITPLIKYVQDVLDGCEARDRASL